VLSDAELVEIWRAADAQGGPYGAGVKLLLLTAARREEIFGLSEGELDLDGAAVRLPAARTKVKEGRTIPLSPPAVAILAALPRLAGPYLLSATGERPWCDFPRSKRYLDARLPGMAPWVLHDIRRSVATGLQRLGARLETIEAVLGHVSGSRRGIVGTYQRHAFEAEARQALDAWGRHIEALLSGARNNVVAISARR
jgi:integrase